MLAVGGRVTTWDTLVQSRFNTAPTPQHPPVTVLTPAASAPASSVPPFTEYDTGPQRHCTKRQPRVGRGGDGCGTCSERNAGQLATSQHRMLHSMYHIQLWWSDCTDRPMSSKSQKSCFVFKASAGNRRCHQLSETERAHLSSLYVKQSKRRERRVSPVAHMERASYRGKLSSRESAPTNQC